MANAPKKDAAPVVHGGAHPDPMPEPAPFDPTPHAPQSDPYPPAAPDERDPYGDRDPNRLGDRGRASFFGPHDGPEDGPKEVKRSGLQALAHVLRQMDERVIPAEHRAAFHDALDELEGGNQ